MDFTHPQMNFFLGYYLSSQCLISTGLDASEIDKGEMKFEKCLMPFFFQVNDVIVFCKLNCCL